MKHEMNIYSIWDENILIAKASDHLTANAIAGLLAIEQRDSLPQRDKKWQTDKLEKYTRINICKGQTGLIDDKRIAETAGLQTWW